MITKIKTLQDIDYKDKAEGTTIQTIPEYWNLASIWNNVAMRENKELKPRDYIYASEIGSPLVDRYLKMKAIPYTNPPNNRSLRKFLAGNILEFITKQILIASGVYKHDEIKVDATPYPDCLPVHGRLDFKAGGYIDKEEALARLNGLNLPDYLFTVGRKIIDQLEGKLLVEKILELKSCSTFVMDKVERSRMAIPQHTGQAYHYQRNGNITADVCYICKDDCRMAQFPVNAELAEPIYRKDLEQMTHYFNTSKQPPIEPLAKFDEVLGKFSKNLGVEYSPYLSMLYGFKDPDEYRKAVKYIDSWNRCLGRYVMVELGQKTPTGKPIQITTKNAEIRMQWSAAGYNVVDLIECRIKAGIVEDEEEVTE